MFVFSWPVLFTSFNWILVPQDVTLWRTTGQLFYIMSLHFYLSNISSQLNFNSVFLTEEMWASWCITPRNTCQFVPLLMIIWLMWLLPVFSTDGKIHLHSRISITTCSKKDRNRKSPFGRHHRWWCLPGFFTSGEIWPFGRITSIKYRKNDEHRKYPFDKHRSTYCFKGGKKSSLDVESSTQNKMRNKVFT